MSESDLKKLTGAEKEAWKQELQKELNVIQTGLITATAADIQQARQEKTLYAMAGVYGLKPNHTNSSVKRKARFVVRGDMPECPTI